MRNVVCMLCYVREFIRVIRTSEIVFFKIILSYCSDAFNYTIIIPVVIVEIRV